MNKDTICAVSTPPGKGGIAVIRLSGPDAFTILARAWKGKNLHDCPTHTAHLGDIVDPDSGELLDNAVVTLFRGPGSFTGDDTAEISIHGSAWIQGALLKLLARLGARLAEPGEFTRRAFASGRLDLVQAEAVADVIAAESRAAHRIASSQMRGSFSRRLEELREALVELASLLELELDFSDQEVEFASRERLRTIAESVENEIDRLCKSFDSGRAIATGIPVVIVGDTNAGKSTLLNRLLDDDRAIVSEYRGTTRDTIEDTAMIGDVLFRFIDTAGIRETDDPVEKLGIERSRKALEKARIILWVIDPAEGIEGARKSYHRIFDVTEPSSHREIPCGTHGRTPVEHLMIITNKNDISHADFDLSEFNPTATLSISALSGNGIEELKETLLKYSNIDTHPHDVTVTNIRHFLALTEAKKSIGAVLQSLKNQEYIEFVAQHLRETLRHLGEITGQVTDSEILTSIFSRFCIGK